MESDELLERLERHRNQVVVLKFTDGEETEALLLGVNQRERDVTFEVRRLISAAAAGPAYTTVGTTYIAPLDEVEAVLPMSRSGS